MAPGWRLFHGDGGLKAQAVVDVLFEQAGLIRGWPERGRLKMLAGRLHGLLSELGML